MSDLTREDIQRIVEELSKDQPWHHNIELPYGIWTLPDIEETYAKNISKWERINPVINKIDLSNSRVLDVGCSDGYYSFEIAKMGPTEVIAIDLNHRRLKKAEFVKQVLGIKNVTFINKGIEDVAEEKLGHFNISVCLGFLHRYPDPYGLLQKLATISDCIVLEWKLHRSVEYGFPVMTFATGHIHGIDEYNVSYWYPTFECVIAILKRFGFNQHYPIDDGINKRVALISTRNKNETLDDHYATHSKSIPKVLKKYTINYLKTVGKVLLGRI